ncbi:Uncharacterized protein BM_BM10754 [Brugia malayi]|uniref:Bm10754 n=1 Tax=Brugia malayi TaxID=6279 RepID=A0A0K0IPD2_BRUMA|nr:Uncharacterized protein BM_BM10754 [Brugia malayi]CDP99428.1 Bm10754 [Brugia malayi]VIO99875.1 Uncharacterized protein BM_BM10754 [Brugia malayi]
MPPVNATDKGLPGKTTSSSLEAIHAPRASWPEILETVSHLRRLPPVPDKRIIGWVSDKLLLLLRRGSCRMGDDDDDGDNNDNDNDNDNDDDDE